MSAGLFEIRLGERSTAAPQKVEFPARAESPFRQAEQRGLHRHCSGCGRETEHVLFREGDGAGLPAIRWPAVKAASGTTICVDCGQWRAAARQPARMMKKAIATY
ncbi:MAG TPA: hypothetical protein VIL96_01945 [Gaiellaceae bacterium]|jgi:hypothetical protein